MAAIMGAMQGENHQPVTATRPRRRGLRVLSGAVALMVVFYLGLAVGDGKFQRLFEHHIVVTKNLPAHLDYDQVDEVYQSLKDNYDGQLTNQQLIDGLKHGLAESTKDPYTVYFTAKEAEDFNNDLNGSFSGIGAQLGQDEDGNIQIISPIQDLPADRAGLKALDLIVTVNGESTAGWSIDKAVSKIRGEKGTKVKLQVVRNHAESLDFTITRDDINLPSVKTKTLDGNIGYMQINTFGDDTAELMQKAAQTFKDANVNGVVLDLRGNPGGLLDAAVDVSSLWLDRGQTVLQEKRGGVVTDTYSATGRNPLKGIPTVVLIDGGSASASEITAGALHDNKDAYVIGEKSYGKGVVQQLINLSDGSQLKVTVASWYRPNGQNINHKGITPDKTVKISDDDLKASNDTQLKAAQDYLATKH